MDNSKQQGWGRYQFFCENIGKICWKAFKGGGGLILCGWAIYVFFLVLSTHPCWQSSGCLAVGLLRGQINLLERAINEEESAPTGLEHIVFGIAASAQKWKERKPFIELWWRPGQTRGFVWLDQSVNETDSQPPVRISEDTSRFNYTHPRGSRSAIRISRIVSESFRLGLPNVRWFVMGDDDTVFIPENLVRVLSKYDHRQMYYVGSNSESAEQNMVHSYGMAYGGGGFAISYPLAKALAKVQDDCLGRYPDLYGSDQRVQACLAELGVPLTKEPGFHQFDIHGNLFGLLAAHPVAPLVSLHHLDNVASVFPNMNRTASLRHLMKAAKADPDRLLQQSICYDRRRNWTVSVSWGYCVQIMDKIELPRILESPLQTFLTWGNSARKSSFLFNARTVARNPCERPTVVFLQDIIQSNLTRLVGTTYTKRAMDWVKMNCSRTPNDPESLHNIRVLSHKMQHDWTRAPRRQCCEVVSSDAQGMEIKVRNCANDETVFSPS